MLYGRIREALPHMELTLPYVDLTLPYLDLVTLRSGQPSFTCNQRVQRLIETMLRARALSIRSISTRTTLCHVIN